MGRRTDVKHSHFPFSTRSSDTDLRIVAQILGQEAEVDDVLSPLQDHDLIVGSGRQQYASLTWEDFWAIAPWLEEEITRQIDGPGLGI